MKRVTPKKRKAKPLKSLEKRLEKTRKAIDEAVVTSKKTKGGEVRTVIKWNKPPRFKKLHHHHPKPTAKEKAIEKLLKLIFGRRGDDALKFVLTKITCEKQPSEKSVMPSFTLQSDQQIRLAVQPVKGSKPTLVDGNLTWEVIQGDAVKVLQSPKGLKALIVPNADSTSKDDTIVNVSGDADRGDGVKTIELNLTFLVVASQADAIEIVGDAVTEPLEDNPTAPDDDV